MQEYLTERLGLSQDELDHGGYIIQTTLDPELQRAGDAAVVATLPLGDTRAATFSAVEPGTGHLLALSVNRIFGYDRNDPTQESFNLNVAPSRGAGSTVQGVRRGGRAGPGVLDGVHAEDVGPVLLPRLRGGRRAVQGP